jgi:hypothetical protein
MSFTVTSRTELPATLLVYRRDEFSLDTLNRYAGGLTSIVVNDVQLEVSEKGEVSAVWGMCPHTTWVECEVPLPDYQPARLIYEGEIIPGVSIGVNATDNRWQVRHDPQTGWIAVVPDRIPTSGEAVEFLPGCLAQLDQAGELLCLWLKPDIL